MFNWAKQTLGVTEPVYGPSAIQSVAEQAKDTPYTELTKNDMKWECMDSTNVETKTFYMLSNEGRVGMVQVIYSNVMGIRTTAQFSSKIFSKDPNGKHIWSSDNISHFQFSPDMLNFKADACSMELSEDGKTYHIKSTVSKNSIVDVKFTQVAPAFVVGKNGTSYYGTDPQKPWGRMWHQLWPRCKVEGQILTPEGPVDFNGGGMHVAALQGMKPHFAAAKWNFCDFQSPTFSAVLMDFTTPPSYGETTVAIGCIAKDGEIVFAGASPSVKAEHTTVKGDPENSWPEPSAVRFSWEGKSSDGKEIKAEISDSLGVRADRMDVMGELPKFVKQIVGGVAGTKPYIYQYTPKVKLKLDLNGETVEEEGTLFMEATFITEGQT